MTQITQFIMWTIRDFGRFAKKMTPSKFLLLATISQFGALVTALLIQDRTLVDFLAGSIPVTSLLMFIALFVETQWDRFKREQERILNTLKDAK